MTKTEDSSSKSNIMNANPSQSWVLFLKSTVLDNDKTDIVHLRHPRSGLPSMYLFTCNDSLIYEVFAFSENRSWFVNDSVRENGKLYVSTPLDPLFLILPYLKKSKEELKVLPAEDLIIDEKYPETCRLLKSSGFLNLHLLADRKGPEDLNAWMYNEEKVLNWLSKKTEKVANVLQEKQNKQETSSKLQFGKIIEKESHTGKDLFMEMAYNIISEYLTDDLSLKLQTTLGLSVEPTEKTPAGKRKSTYVADAEDGKKFKPDEELELKTESCVSKTLKSKKNTKTQVPIGTRSIMSFFKK
ncbi:hypothetical protein RUM44_003834 [Polyplax serrata]|uniref:Ribonuclease H2 subunit B n=1 Tax=Polyplax serrata TaxID=468196 RepID=A0ABR1B131_POLSC